jgi:hypothetical protein
MVDCEFMKNMKTRHIYLALMLALGAAHASAAPSLTIESAAPIGAVAEVPGYPSPQGDYASFFRPENIAQGKSVIVSSTIVGYPAIHNMEFLTDGNYGNGSSWIAGGPVSEITVDLGGDFLLSSVVFGRDRLLTGFSDRSPGQFTVAVSLDGLSYATVMDSSALVFSGVLVAGQGVRSTFDPVQGRYVKLSLSNSAAAVDEVEIFSAVPEPTSQTLAFSGLLLVALRKKKKRVSSTQ